MNNISELKFPNKIVKFRFYIEDIDCKLKLSKLLTLISVKYSPEIFYIKQLEDIRNLLKNINDLKEIIELFEIRRYKFKDLFESFILLKNNWNNLPIDLKAYIIVSFSISYLELLKHLESKLEYEE